jgi:hypothetical protein
MKPHILSVLGFIVATFVTQAPSHLVLFAQHYAAVPYIKSEPIFALGVLAMIVQGSVMSFAFVRQLQLWRKITSPRRHVCLAVWRVSRQLYGSGRDFEVRGSEYSVLDWCRTSRGLCAIYSRRYLPWLCSPWTNGRLMRRNS